MTEKLTAPPKKEYQSFHDFPIVTDLDNFEADIAFLGIPFGDPYSMGEASKVWLYNSLKSLNISLENNLNFFKGNALDILKEIIKNKTI